MLTLVLSTIVAVAAPAPGATKAAQQSRDSAVSIVDDCVCFLSEEGRRLKPWEKAWNNPEQLKQQISHCDCKVRIELKSVGDPSRYVEKARVIK